LLGAGTLKTRREIKDMFGYEFAYGTVGGLHHSDPVNLKSNQDALVVISSENRLAAVVCDGCSGGKNSEVGAKIGARLIAQELCQIEKLLRNYNGENPGYLTALLEKSRQDILAQLRILAEAMGGSFTETIRGYFLFTVLGLLMTPDLTFFFHNGDGLFLVNGNKYQIGPFPEDKPPYLAYGMVETDFTQAEISFTLDLAIPTSEVDSVVIGSDGLADLINSADRKLPGKEKTFGPINQFWEEDIFFRNPDAIRRRLVSANLTSITVDRDGNLVREVGFLPDDTTLVVVRKQKEEAGAGSN